MQDDYPYYFINEQQRLTTIFSNCNCTCNCQINAQSWNPTETILDNYRQQQSHHQHHHNGPLSDQLQQQHQPLPHQHHQPAQVSSGFNGGAPGLGVVSQTVHTNQPKAVPANHINHYNNNHPGQQQPMPILVGGSPQIVPMHPQQRMDSTVATATAPPATTVMPKSNTIQYHPAPQQATPSHAPLNNHHFAHSNPAATGVSSGTMIDQPPPHAGNTRQQQQQQSIAPPDSSRQVRLTLPSQLLGPFRLEHGVQCTSKVFHIKKDLFDALSKSMSPYGAQTAANIQELQFRAYLIDQHHQRDNKSTTGGGDSLLAHNHHHHNHNHHPHQSQQQHHSSPLASTNACNWPELFQISINQQVVHLDRSTVSPPSIGCGPAGSSNGKPPLAHKAVDIFQYCNLGDNIIDIQVNDCYCSHEFVLELVDRPTLKAFINSCFKSRLLSNESCLNKLHSNFGAPGFLVQQAPGTNSGIFNEYITEYIQQPNGQQVEQTRARISLRCPITGRRMRTPARGLNCKHIQCFDLENFIYQNHNRTRWNCPLCSQPIPFTMLELDQFQMNIVQSMSSIQNTDDVLIDPNGQWQSYYAPSSPLPPQNATNPVKTQHQPRNGPSGGNTPAMHYQQQQQQQQQNMGPGHHQSVQRIQQAPPQSSGGSGSGQMMMQHTTAKANGTFHPQLSMPPSSGMSSPAMVGMASNHGMHQSPARPMSGGGCIGQSSPASGGSNWDHQHVGSQPPAELRSSPPGGVRRPPSAMGQSSSTGSRSATGGTLAKRANNNSSNNNYASSRYSSPQPGPMCTGNQSPQIASQPHGQPALSGPGATPAPGYFHAPESGDTDELSPLAAMERTIIQHEQQMGPPPFDPNSLTSSPLKPAGPVGPQPPIAQSPSSASNNFASPQHQQMSTAIQPSPAEVLANQKTSSAAGSAGGFSPLPSQPVPSPAATGRSTVPASPQAQQTRLPQSPMQQQQHQHQTTVSAQMSISTPATPLQIHGGPETPATPSNSVQQHCGPNSVSASHQNNSPHVGSGAGGHVVDHQPLSNGSASVASITSTSTLTPSGQSLGSVGMGGDSRCNTAPLQNALGSLDDLVVLPGVGGSAQGSGVGGGNSSSSGGLASGHPSAAYSKQQSMPGGSASNNGDDDDHNVVQFDDKSDIFMSKLMMDSNDSLLRDRSHHELALALEEAEWKQQLDRGKSEHLANFLNEPLMNKRHHHNHHHQHSDNRHHHHHHNQDDQQHHYQHHNNGNNNNNDNHHQAGDVDGANKMLSGGLNPSDDEGNSSPHGSSPGHNGLDQLDHYTNYLDSGSADDGAGLPPDDSILDLFER